MDSVKTEAGAPAAIACSSIPVEVGTPFLDGSDRKVTTASEGVASQEISSAVGQTREDSLSELLEPRDFPIYTKMDDLGGSLFPDGFAWNITDSLAGGVADPGDSALDGSLSKSVELKDSPIGLEMEYLDGILSADDSASKVTDLVGIAGVGVAADVDVNLENSLADGLEIGGSPADVKMEEVSMITPSGVDNGASLIPKPAAIDRGDESDTHDDDSSSETESDDSSSEDTESSSSSSSEEEDELDEDDVCKGDGEESLELVLGLSEEEEGDVVKGPIRSKNELENLPPVPPVEVSLEPHHQTVQVGLILSILDNKVIIEGSANHGPLNEGSILWITDTRSPLGLIDEIFGPVKCPYYVIRFNSDKDIPSGIQEGTSVSFVSEFACHVLEKDISRKGYDVSGDNDEELKDELEFSDDEKEAEYRKSLRQAKRGTGDKKQWNQESDTHKKKTNIKARGSEKGMNQPVSGGIGKSIGHSTAPIAPYGTLSGTANIHVSSSSIPTAPSQLVSGGDFANPPRQFFNQPSALTNNGLPGMQQPFVQPRQFFNQPSAFPNNGVPRMQQPYVHPQVGMSIPILQQQYSVLPFGLPFQQLPNAVAAGFQMNGLNQQMGVEAFHHQLQNQNASNIQNMMLYAQHMHPGSNMPTIGNNFSNSFISPGQAYMSAQLGDCNLSNEHASASSHAHNMHPNPNMPSIGNNFSTSFMSPGQAYMSAQLGNSNSSNEHTPASSQGQMRPHLQFNPGNSSGHRRNPTKYGGRHRFRGGARNGS